MNHLASLSQNNLLPLQWPVTYCLHLACLILLDLSDFEIYKRKGFRLDRAVIIHGMLWDDVFVLANLKGRNFNLLRSKYSRAPDCKLTIVEAQKCPYHSLYFVYSHSYM